MSVSHVVAPVGERRRITVRSHRHRHIARQAWVQPPDWNELGRRMRKLRTGLGYSQTQIAAILSVSKQTISNWELGVAPPSLDSIGKFAAVAEIDMAELLTGLSHGLRSLSGRRAATRIVPLFKDLQRAGKRIMRLQTVEPDRYVAPFGDHNPLSVSFVVEDRANAPRFQEGDVITISPATMAQPGSMVLAHVDGRFVFRRFLPKVEGRVEGAVLRALNTAYPDIEMRKGDSVAGQFAECISTRQE
jgi:transcriptional regulator with XRE-family HTH domain